jgi:hypothetical protein
MKNQQKEVSLLFCILMDFIGYASYAIPFFGEFADILWAPVSAFIFYRTFGGWKGAFGGMFNFVEELMPGLDFIPTFTLTWVFNYYKSRKTAGSNQVVKLGTSKKPRVLFPGSTY